MLESDYIVKAYDFFDDDKAFYLICELCKGPTLLAFLNEHIRTGRILQEKDAAEIFRQLLEAVKHIHEHKNQLTKIRLAVSEEALVDGRALSYYNIQKDDALRLVLSSIKVSFHSIF